MSLLVVMCPEFRNGINRKLGQACGELKDKCPRGFTQKGNVPLPEKQAIDGFEARRRVLQSVTRLVQTFDPP